MAYTPYRRGPLDPVIDVALIETLIARVTELNARVAPLESAYAGLAANAYGATAGNDFQQDDIAALADQLAGVAAYVTGGALASIPNTTTTMYANTPAFAVRAYAAESRLTAIGA